MNKLLHTAQKGGGVRQVRQPFKAISFGPGVIPCVIVGRFLTFAYGPHLRPPLLTRQNVYVAKAYATRKQLCQAPFKEQRQTVLNGTRKCFGLELVWT